MDLQQPKVLVRLQQTEATKGKNVMVGEAKPDLRGKELAREAAYEKTPDGKETFKIIVKSSGHGGQGSSTPSGQPTTEPVLDRAVRPMVQGGPCTWLPKDAYSVAARDWKLEAQHG
jgi:hypothetical protein